MKSLTILLSTFFLLAFSAIAQEKGKISGKVLSANNTPISSATIIVQGVKGAVSDIDGRYLIALPVGKYQLTITAVGYEDKIINDVTVSNNQVTDLEAFLDAKANKLSGVTVRASSSAKRETINTAIQFQKNTNTVAQVISAEAIKRSPDRNTSEVLKRVSGASIQDGKFIIVRGLADRYNQATINGALLNSTEPDRKTFSFDIFPSSILDNIVINKAAVPELPGEFSGGLVQLNTKDVVDKDFLTLVIGGGFNSQAVSNPFYTYKGGNTDFLGKDDGTRKLPSGLPATTADFNGTPNDQLIPIAQKFNDNWGYNKRGGLINKSFQLSGGKTIFRSGVRKLSAIASVSYNEQFRSMDKLNKFTEGDNIVRYNYNDNVSADNILLGGIANISYQSSAFKLSWKNSYSINSSDQYTMRSGFTNAEGFPVNRLAYQTSFRSNGLFNSQLVGEHVAGKKRGIRLKWNANFATLDQQLPDLKNMTYQEVNAGGKIVYQAIINPNVPRAENAGRFFSGLNDKIYGLNLDGSFNFDMFSMQQVLKVGGLYQRKNRDFNSRIFGFKLNFADDNLIELPIDQILNKQNYASGNLYMNETTSASNSYDAFVNLGAGYVQFDNKFSEKLKLTWGVRVESFDQEVSFVNSGTRTRSGKTYFDVLPSLNFNYLLTPKTNVRVSASRTVSRPEFREISAFAFYDFEKNSTITGNQSLERAQVTNLDARYEIYPRSGELLTVGVFYKHFAKPIESTYGFNSGIPEMSFANAKSADNYGAELEVRKRLDFIGAKVFGDITAFANLAVIHSKVSFGTSAGAEADRPMQGQSPFILNGGLQYNNETSKTNASVLVNRIGRRIYQVGFQGFPNIYEAPRTVLDLQITQALSKKWELKATVSDLLNQKANFYQDKNNDKKYSASQDNLFNSMQYGINFGLNLTYNF